MKWLHKLKLRDFFVMLLIFLVGMVGAYGFHMAGLRTENTFILFILAMTVCILETNSPLWGFILGVGYPLTFDLLFIEPRFALHANDPNFLVSCVIFFIVAFMLGSLTSRLKEQLRSSQRAANVMENLSEISTGLINSSSAKNTCAFISRELSSSLGLPIKAHRALADTDGEAARLCYQRGVATGAGEDDYSKDTHKYLPIRLDGRQYGHLDVDCTTRIPSATERSFLQSVAAQAAIALERNGKEATSSADEADRELEKTKAELLDNISLTMKEPLQKIDAAILDVEADEESELSDSHLKALDSIRETEQSLLQAVDRLRYIASIENMTEMPEKNEVDLNKTVRGITHSASRRYGRTIRCNTARGWSTVAINRRMLHDVLDELIDNAVHYSLSTAAICVTVVKRYGMVTFTVEDTGPGVPEEKVAALFQRFPAGSSSTGNIQRIGLGLSLCKAIVEAQGGFIYAENNNKGGLSVVFSLPAK
jgi:two-component system sensor histidine kinase KdpD